MTGPSDDDIAVARRSRRIALTIAGAAIFLMVAEFAGAAFDLPGRLMGLIEIAVLAVMGWSIYETVAIWRARRNKE